MKEFINKLIERLEEEHERCINRYGVVGGNLPAMEVKQCMGIVNQLAEEYAKDTYVQTIDVTELVGKNVQTNADRIRAMSDEELAKKRIDRIDMYTKSNLKEYIGDFKGIANSEEEAINKELDWLQSEAE